MNIAISFNKKYYKYAVVLLTSIGENNPVPIDVFILHDKLSEDDFQRLSYDVSKYQMNIHPITINPELFDKSIFTDSTWTLEAYYRLQMFDLLPQDLDRVLYLDIDITVNKNLSELYNMSFEGNDMIVFENNNGNNGIETLGPKGQEMLGPLIESGHKYFNSGVCLFNFKKMQKEYSFSTYAKAFLEWNFEMEAPDQDILNFVHAGKVKYADHIKYDLFPRIAHQSGITYEEVKSQIAIIHFVGHKPWNNEMFHFDIERIWWDYARETPYYEELIQEFFDDAFSNNYLENFINNLAIKNEQLSTHVSELSLALSKMKELINKLSSTP